MPGADLLISSFGLPDPGPVDRERPEVGGQAIMHGVAMRSQRRYALAIRRADGDIWVECRPWRGFARSGIKSMRYLRGFPILVETLLNGLAALNRSAELEGRGDQGTGRRENTLTLLAALVLGLAMFVLLPHLLAQGMAGLGMGGSAGGLVFHLWDGLFKFAVLVLYILGISLLPDIREVFRYHGAEHKAIAAFERGGLVSAQSAAGCSRLHARCGTTFLFFVLLAAVLMHALILPPLLWVWQPENPLIGHALLVLLKAALLVPVSCLAYEFVHLAARWQGRALGALLLAPGLFLQLLTTREPDHGQLEVAVSALAEALGDAYDDRFQTPAYSVLE